MLASCLTLLGGTARAAGGTTAAPDPNAPWMHRCQAIIEQAVQADEPDWVRPEITERQRRWARKILEHTQPMLEKGRPDSPAPDPDNGNAASNADVGTVRVFLTLGENDADRRRFVNQLRALAGRENVEVVLRGLPRGMRRIGELIGLLADITEPIDNAPPVMLHPERFRQADVEVSPTVVFYRDGAPLARIAGSLEIAWLRARVEAGHRGRLGIRGQVHAIAERDLMSVIRERWASIDWKKIKRQAIRDYWHAYEPTALPEAREPRVSTVEPSIVVARTLRTPEGRVIARKGQRINPLALVPFTGAIIAFDGRSPEQIAVAGLLAERVRADGLRAILLTQGLPGGGEPSFKALARLERTLGARVYLLDTRAVERFDLQALPALVRTRGTVFKVRELPPAATPARLSKASEEAQQ
ncbi:MAG: hypothetical protein J5I81_08060 [Nitrococcus mobilis]|nr:hypothetical protein [Nitrococcus mobilis]